MNADFMATEVFAFKVLIKSLKDSAKQNGPSSQVKTKLSALAPTNPMGLTCLRKNQQQQQQLPLLVFVCPLFIITDLKGNKSVIGRLTA